MDKGGEKSSLSYKKMFLICALTSFVDGLYYPFLIAFLVEIGGTTLMGLGLGLITIADSFGTYFAGKLSDDYGRKPFLLTSLIIGLFVFLSYPLIGMIENNQIFIYTGLILLFIIDGITEGMWGTVEAVYLGDITHITHRGKMLGSYWGVSGIIFGIAMIGAGFLGVYINFLTVAIIAAIIYLVAISLLFQIKDTIKTQE